MIWSRSTACCGGDGGELLVETSVPPAARVFGRVITPARGPKLIVFKKKRRKIAAGRAVTASTSPRCK